MHCACGATRDAPAGLTIVSCVACGAAMTRSIPIQYATPPARTLVTTATFATQLLGTLAFALALVWIVALRITAPPIIAVLLAGAVAVFAGGHAHRGNVIALGVCTAFDLAVAVFILARLSATEAFAWPALARLHVAPTYFLLAAGILAALAAIACIAAMPQARRFAAWRVELLAARMVR
jgi:hypothetical protein